MAPTRVRLVIVGSRTPEEILASICMTAPAVHPRLGLPSPPGVSKSFRVKKSSPSKYNIIIRQPMKKPTINNDNNNNSHSENAPPPSPPLSSPTPRVRSHLRALTRKELDKEGICQALLDKFTWMGYTAKDYTFQQPHALNLDKRPAKNELELRERLWKAAEKRRKREDDKQWKLGTVEEEFSEKEEEAVVSNAAPTVIQLKRQRRPVIKYEG